MEYDGQPYLGAVHGLVGILYMILKAMQVVDELSEERELAYVVRQTVLDISDIITQNDG